MKKVRNSNIELLRIICMMLVIIHHFTFHTNWGQTLTDNNRMVLHAMGLWPAVAINCFVIICGYFMCEFSGNTKGKAFRLWKERAFYSILITLIWILAGMEEISLSSLAKAFLPIITCRHSYVTTFIFLYLFIPYINKFINSLYKEEFCRFLVISTIILSVLPSIFTNIAKLSSNTYSYLLWMIYLYCLGAYFKKYPLSLPWLSIFVLSIVLCIAVYCFIVPGTIGLRHANRNSMLMLICSIALFNTFSNINIGNFKCINWVSGSTFAVLLIHDDPLIRKHLWSWIIGLFPDMGSSPFLWGYLLIIPIFIHSCCIIIDKLLFRFVNIPSMRSIIPSQSNK